MPSPAKDRLVRFLRWTEKYTKTDMVYLASAGWWLNLDLAIQSILSLGLSIALANLLSPSVYGTYQYLVAISALVAAVCLSGMNSAVTQAVARGREGVLRESVRFQLRWAVVPFVLTLGGAAYYFAHAQNEIAFGLVAIALFTPFVQTFNTYVAFLTGKKAFKDMFFLKLLANLVYYVPIFAVLPFVRDAAILVAVNVLFTAVGNFYAYRKTLTRFNPNDTEDPEAVRYGAHLSVMSGFGTVINQLDSVLVFHFLGPIDLAVYSLATLIPERMGGILGFVGTAALPKFSNRTLNDIRGVLLAKMAYAMAVGTLTAIIYAAIAPFIFRLLFPAYVAAIPYTQLYAAVIIFLSTNLAYAALQAKRLQTELYIISVVNPIMLIVLQVPLLLLYGIWGMLWARIISDAMNFMISIVLLYRASGKSEPRPSA